MEDIRYKKQLEDNLQAVQRLYMKLWGKKECVEFYTKYIQPIYQEFKANTAITKIYDITYLWDLKPRRESLNMDLEDVSNKTGISKGDISRIELGLNNCNKTISKLNDFYSSYE